MTGYSYIFWTVFFTVYGQLILKWRIAKYGDLPEIFSDKIVFLFRLLFDPFILSGLLAAFIASFFWMAAMTKLELSIAYPFMSSAFILVFLFSVFLFQESINSYKIIGLILITSGLLVTSQSTN